MDIAAYLAIALAFFAVAVSPGPANIANAVIAMDRGRAASFRFSLGLTTGIAVWGIVAATGLGAILQTSVYLLSVLKVLGGIYLLYLAWQSARAARDPAETRPASVDRDRLFVQGIALNLSNPKTVIAWMAALSVGLSETASPAALAIGVAICTSVALLVNMLYMLLFSLSGVMAGYRRIRRWINYFVAGLFSIAGLGLIRSAFAK
ncbi:MAG: LysE family translocator [Pseudomonadota bacterium]